MKIKELGHIVLYVTDIKKLSKFYREILGFKQIAENESITIFSAGRTHHELLLIEIGGKQKKKTLEPGLYHFGLKIGDRPEDLKSALEELIKNKVQIVGTGDHTITKSIYIKDPDGNEIELYIDVTDEWKKNPRLLLTPVKELRL